MKVTYAVDEQTGCWNCTSHMTSGRAAPARFEGKKRISLHHEAYVAANGPIPEGHIVWWSCENPFCLNPDHLVSGPRGERYRQQRARRLAGREKGTRRLLTGKMAEALRTSVEPDDVLAARHNLDISLVRLVRRAADWRDDPANNAIHPPRIQGRYRKPIKWVESPTGCHECVSHTRNEDGYPVIENGGRISTVARTLYIRRYGQLDDGLVVRHSCDNRLCIKLEHLLPGTPADNSRDAAERERIPRGEQSPRAVLTEEDVREIWLSPELARDVATRLGVSQHAVAGVRAQDSWGWLTRSLPPQPERHYCSGPKPVEYEVDEQGCHICTSHALDFRKRPKMKWGGKVRPVAEMVYIQQVGPIPDGYEAACHLGQLKCVRADHLRLRPRPIVAKLTDDDVRAIRRSTESGPELAKRYGVHTSIIYNVRNRKRWAHVPDESGADNGAVNR